MSGWSNSTLNERARADYGVWIKHVGREVPVLSGDSRKS